MSVVFIEIDSPKINEGRSGTSRSGQPYTIPPTQNGYLWQGQKYPKELEIPVHDETGPLQPGFYLLSSDCFAQGQYGLSFDDRKLRLIPLDKGIDELKALASEGGQGASAPSPASSDKGK